LRAKILRLGENCKKNIIQFKIKNSRLISNARQTVKLRAILDPMTRAICGKVGCIIARQGGVGVQRPMPARLRSALHCIQRFSQSVGDDALALSYALIHNMHRCRAARVALVARQLPSAHFRANSATIRHWPLVLDHHRP
jgi:hypothetical protein